MTADRSQNLERWVREGLITQEQRTAILEFERDQVQAGEPPRQSLVITAIGTIGAAIAVAGVAGTVVLFAQDWSATEATVAAALGALVTIAAAWFLLRNGWGAPAGVLVLCGLALLPLAFVLAANALGWWPETPPGGSDSDTLRGQERIIGGALLLAILPGMLTTRRGLRQAWAALPAAVWFGTVMLFTDPLETALVAMAQVLAGGIVAALATFVWGADWSTRNAAWWVQIGSLGLMGFGIASSTGHENMLYPFLAVVMAGVVLAIGIVRNRIAWMVAGVVPALPPATRLIFTYFEGVAGLLLLAIVGLAVAFLPVLLWRRGWFSTRPRSLNQHG
jgi:hypothetical protein